MLLYLLLFLTSFGCILTRASSLGNAVVGVLGIAVAILGLVLAFDVSGSAAAMVRFSDAVRSGAMPISGADGRREAFERSVLYSSR